MNGRTIELSGGPLDGVIHELEPGFPMPDTVLLPGPDWPENQERHSYQVDTVLETATYKGSQCP